MAGITKNRIFYIVFMAVVLFFFGVYGGRMLQLILYVLLLLPAVSWLAAFVLLRTLRVQQRVEKTTVVKGEESHFCITLKNNTPFWCDNVHAQFTHDRFIVMTAPTVEPVQIKPFFQGEYAIGFYIKYRGTYAFGLQSLEIIDFMGLFRLRRKIKQMAEIVVYPRVIDIAYFPLARRLLSQSHSHYEIKEEDYAEVSDIRPYVPTDSMKRIHWKLTARRNQWMVKNFHANALNSIILLMDTDKILLHPENTVRLEDKMVETAIGIMQYCLRMQMPVEFAPGEGSQPDGSAPGVRRGRHSGDFDDLYQAAATLCFTDGTGKYAFSDRLGHYLNETTSYINILILTAKLDKDLYDKIINANNFGHFAALLYFVSGTPDAASEAVYRKLVDSGTVCYRVTESTTLHASA